MSEPKTTYVNLSFHPDLCVGCGACVAACLDEYNNLPIVKPLLRRVYCHEAVTDGAPRLTWYSLACLHCDEPACKAACPKDCFTLEPATGTVHLDNTNCIGCRLCARACPYQGIVFDEDRKASKCDGCAQRLRIGRLPRCMEACPCRAITVNEGPTVRAAVLERLAEDLQTIDLI